MNPYPFRFATAEDARLFMRRAGGETIPPFKVVGDLVILNQEYRDAPFEISPVFNQELVCQKEP